MHQKRERKCISCRETKNQYDMLRVAKIGDELVIDKFHKLGGRGAYICTDDKCLELAIKKRLLNRAFKSNLDVSIYEKLGEYEQDK